MLVESTNDPHAVSSKGAMGLMQIMPATWKDLRRKHGLGDDPFLPRDNMMAGAAYLRDMLDRFGRKGFLAAYNAGPTRYEEHLVSGRPLPRETVDYVAKLMPMIDGVVPVRAGSRRSGARHDAVLAPLFVQSGRSGNADSAQADRETRAVSDSVFSDVSGQNEVVADSNAVTDVTAIAPQSSYHRFATDTTGQRSRSGLFVLRSSGFTP